MRIRADVAPQRLSFAYRGEIEVVEKPSDHFTCFCYLLNSMYMDYA